MSAFELVPLLIVAVWSLPLLIVATLIVRYWRGVRRDARLHADFVAAGASPERAAALLTLLREEAS